MKLRGRAQALMLAHPDYTFDRFVALLRNQFGESNQRAACEAQLAQYRRKKDESIPQLKLAITQLATWIYGADQSENIARLVKDHFIRALNDSALIAEVYRQMPKDIEEAATFACEYDAYFSSGRMPRTNDPAWPATLPHDAADVCATVGKDARHKPDSTKPWSAELDTILKSLTNLTSSVNQLQKSQKEFATERRPTTSGEQSASNPNQSFNRSYNRQQPTRRYDGPMICFNCGAEGHSTRRCHQHREWLYT